MKKILLSIVLFISVVGVNVADEGMWIPILLEKYNIADMQAKGFKLSAEDIYSINKDCLMDAVVIFGGGCTGELVSDKGLLLTNHHCGYGAIQRHSSIEHDYLTDGFWAMSMEEELPNKNLTATFLKRMEDVTEKVLENVTADMSEDERHATINDNISKIRTEVTEGNHYRASVKPFFYGNQYFLFVYEVYKDVRLVGAPPSAIGKFGGDTDNWMWPRHTGDFSIFRIYADKNNMPAEYSEDNVPYKPKRHLPISIKGINEGDFTWVMGYPGSTQSYLTSDAIKLIADVRNPHSIKLRDIRLEVMNRYADANDTIRIKYASKNARVSNSWKRWIGEIDGLERLKTVEKKQELEKKFYQWVSENNKAEYKGIIEDLAKIYAENTEYAIANDYWRESIRSIEIIYFASRFEKLTSLALNKETSKEDLEAEIEYLKNYTSRFYKDYVKDIDMEIFEKLVPLYFENVDQKFHPEKLDFVIDDKYPLYVEELYRNSLFADENKCQDYLTNFSVDNIGKIENDPAYKFYIAFADVYYDKVRPVYSQLSKKTNSLYRLYIKGLQEMNSDKIYYSDANFTMRVSYGEVKGFEPRDGVKFEYYTTIDGIIEKDNPEIYDYDVPDKLKELYATKDFGRYTQNGTVPVCFVATNHTTGGNSGSPVLDAEGNLIGLNFDRAWHGIQSDMMFDPERSRNVTLDIRYLLFIVDKMAGASHLIEEMTIVE